MSEDEREAVHTEIVNREVQRLRVLQQARRSRIVPALAACLLLVLCQ